MDQYNQLIVYLMAIHEYAKTIHYNCSGEAFYGKHLFADRIVDNLYDYIDLLKEVCLLGHNNRPLDSQIYLRESASLVPQEKASFGAMRELLTEALIAIERCTNTSKGDENLLGAIAQDLQNMVGLINIMLGE